MRIPLKAATWALSAALCAAPALLAQATPAKPAAAPAAAPAATTKPAPPAAVAMPTAQDIATAKTQGMVWVNTSTKVFHKDGAYYGKTKHGKFMTEADATKAGYKAAKEPAAAKAKPAKKS